MRLFSEFGPDHIQGASCFEPFDLWFIVGMVEGDFVFAAVLMVQDHGQGFAGSERAEACDIDAVVLLYFVVIFFARVGQVPHSLSLGFAQEFEPFQVDAFPGGEGGQELEALAVRLDGYLYAFPVFSRGLVARVFYGEAFGGQFHAGGFIEHDVFSLLVLQGIFQGVEGQGACDGEGGDDLRGSHESMGACQSVVAFGKVPVEGGDDGVLTVGIVDMTGPLPDTGSAGIGQHDAADLVESLQKAVFFNGIAYQLRSGGNGEFRFCLQVLVDSLLGQGGGTADIFVRRVGTGADQGYFEAFGPVVGFYGFCEFADGPGQIGGERSINMGFQFIQVDLDHLVVVFFGIAVYFFIGTEVVFDAIRQGGYFFPACAFQVSRHFFVIGE